MARKTTLLCVVLMMMACWVCLGALTNATALQFNRQGLTSLDVTGYPDLSDISCWENQLTSLDLSKNIELGYLDCHRNQLTSLDLSHNPKLYYLSCSDNQLTSLDFSHNPYLRTLYCMNNQLTSLDISQNPALRDLLCYGNQLTSLDVSHSPALDWFSCDNNKLTRLDLSHNPALRDLSCGRNQLTSLDVSHNHALEELGCGGNQLTSLDVSHNPALKVLSCYGNQLTSLDVSHNPDLRGLYCDGNQLTSLDVSHNPDLETLRCEGIQLTSLDISHNPALIDLDCSDNQLTCLDVSQKTALKWLCCNNNQLTCLDLSHNPDLEILYCSNNQLTCLDVSNNPKIYAFSCTDCGCSVPAVNHQFDLSMLPGFDVSRASHWNGGTVNGDILTFYSSRVIYWYDCGNAHSAQFYLEMGDPPQISANIAFRDGRPNQPGDIVTNLYEDASGHFSWETEAGQGCEALTLELEASINDPEVLTASFDVTLSDGFSFSEDATVSSKRLTINTSKQTFHEAVYPINQEKIIKSLTVTLKNDDFEQRKNFNIVQRDQGTVWIPRSSSPYSSADGAFFETFAMNWSNELLGSYANSYSQKMAELCLYLSLSGRDTDTLRESLLSWRFEDLAWNTEDYTGLRSCIAHRKILREDGPINLVVIVANQRGDYSWGDWIIHSTFGEQAYLKPAFYEADADRIVNRMFDYLVAHEMGFANTAILVCGKNDGGAVANVITHRIHTTYNFLKVKGYTFATPNVTANEPGSEANLFNYCYAQDAVTLIPKKFYKYGQTLFVGTGNNIPADVAKQFEHYSGNSYTKPDNRVITGLLLNVDEEKISLLSGKEAALFSMSEQTGAVTTSWKANSQENYLAWLKGNGISNALTLEQLRQHFIVEEGTIKAIQGATGVMAVARGVKPMTQPAKSSLKDTMDGLIEIYSGVRDVCTTYLPTQWNKAKKAVLSFFACPVDVTLYDGDWNAVTRFENHNMVQESNSNLARSWQDVDCDMIASPLSEDYVMLIVGNDEGTMDIATGTFDNDGNLTSNDAFQDIPVYTGATYLSGYLYDATDGGNWTSYVYAASKRTLYINGSVYAEESFVLPSGLSQISEEAFSGDKKIGGLVVVPEGVSDIGSNAFAGTGISVAVIEGSHTSIADNAFGRTRPIIVCKAGSQTAEWATQHGFPCVKLPPLVG